MAQQRRSSRDWAHLTTAPALHRLAIAGRAQLHRAAPFPWLPMPANGSVKVHPGVTEPYAGDYGSTERSQWSPGSTRSPLGSFAASLPRVRDDTEARALRAPIPRSTKKGPYKFGRLNPKSHGAECCEDEDEAGQRGGAFYK